MSTFNISTASWKCPLQMIANLRRFIMKLECTSYDAYITTIVTAYDVGDLLALISCNKQTITLQTSILILIDWGHSLCARISLAMVELETDLDQPWILAVTDFVIIGYWTSPHGCTANRGAYKEGPSALGLPSDNR